MASIIEGYCSLLNSTIANFWIRNSNSLSELNNSENKLIEKKNSCDKLAEMPKNQSSTPTKASLNPNKSFDCKYLKVKKKNEEKKSNRKFVRFNF
jgi:hypothetical protein